VIVSSDWHLDDDPDNSYRWLVFDAWKRQIDLGERRFLMLGDLCEKKDKHSAELVNKLLDAFMDLCEYAETRFQNEACIEELEIGLLRGNHDMPLRGKPFWNLFNSSLMPIKFIDQPEVVDDMLFLPYSADPATEWAALDYREIKVVFIHQTLAGAKAEGIGHREMEGKPGTPKFPPGLKIYSGDIHLPQIVKWGSDVEYVGAPHLVRFGDDHRTRMLRLDESSYEIIEEISLDPPSKLVIACGSIADLRRSAAQQGDQVKIRFTIPLARIEQWPVEEAEIKRWAQDQGIEIASIEPIIEQRPTDNDEPVARFDEDPFSVLAEFAAQEGLDAGLIKAAKLLLKGALNG
jgi:DNA repair exonuclease SbcCD nuclease subunit